MRYLSKSIASMQSRPRLVKRTSPPSSILPHSGPVINKEVINMTPQLYEYVLDHTRESAVLAELREVTNRDEPSGRRMQISPEQGAFMANLIRLMGAKRCIEVGTFTGYSSVCVAQALPEDGLLIALDIDEKTMEVARRYWEKAGVSGRIESHVGPAADSLERLLKEGQAGTFDFAFIDADKRGYDRYYELCLQLVRPGGLIAVDNVLWYGKICDPTVNDKATLALRELNDKIAKDERVHCSIVPIGDGVTLAIKK